MGDTLKFANEKYAEFYKTLNEIEKPVNALVFVAFLAGFNAGIEYEDRTRSEGK